MSFFMSLDTFLDILSHGPFKKSRDGLEVNLNSYGLIRTYQLWMETSTRIIDYHLKDCMVEQKCKNNITGSYLQKGG